MTFSPQGEQAYIEWAPFKSYDVNNHMSFDEWGVIAHESVQEDSPVTPPLQIAIATVCIQILFWVFYLFYNPY